MTSIINYAAAFWSVVVMNCIQPVNWEYCSKDWDQWLYPEIQRGWEIYSNPSTIYQNERDSLENINKDIE
jgi:hypothetical protein